MPRKRLGSFAMQHGWTVLACQAMSPASSMPWTNAKTPACIVNCSRPCSKCPRRASSSGAELYDLGLGLCADSTQPVAMCTWAFNF